MRRRAKSSPSSTRDDAEPLRPPYTQTNSPYTFIFFPKNPVVLLLVQWLGQSVAQDGHGVLSGHLILQLSCTIYLVVAFSRHGAHASAVHVLCPSHVKLRGEFCGFAKAAPAASSHPVPHNTAGLTACWLSRHQSGPQTSSTMTRSISCWMTNLMAMLVFTSVTLKPRSFLLTSRSRVVPLNHPNRRSLHRLLLVSLSFKTIWFKKRSSLLCS